MSKIITLITDLDKSGFYLGEVYGTIYRHFLSSILIDVAFVSPRNIHEAAYISKKIYATFPQKTVHLLLIEERRKPEKILIAEEDGHYFIAPDNGILSLVLQETNLHVFEMNEKQMRWQKNEPAQRIKMGVIAALIASGKLPEELGSLYVNMIEKKYTPASYQSQEIAGNVIFVDQFGNLITNVSKMEFENLKKNFNDFIISIKYKSEFLNSLHIDFANSNEGELIAYFNQHEDLVIAIKNGNAKKLLGMKIGDSIKINFQ